MPETVIIFGRAEQQIGVAGAASEGAVGGADLTVRPILRTAELLEAVPGLIAAAHSGSGKANQYFLRGINLDHGTDFAAFIDDVPLNFRTHGHGQGYLDVNGMHSRNGRPDRLSQGSLSRRSRRLRAGGRRAHHNDQCYDRPFAQAEVGSFGWYRALTGGTFQVAGGSLTLVGQYKTSNGPWELPRRPSALGRASENTAG